MKDYALYSHLFILDHSIHLCLRGCLGGMLETAFNRHVSCWFPDTFSKVNAPMTYNGVRVDRNTVVFLPCSFYNQNYIYGRSWILTHLDLHLSKLCCQKTLQTLSSYISILPLAVNCFPMLLAITILLSFLLQCSLPLGGKQPLATISASICKDQR